MKILPIALVFALPVCIAQGVSPGRPTPRTDALAIDKFELRNVRAEPVTYIGREAIRITDTGAPDLGDAGLLAVLRGSSFQDGVIEVDLTGDTVPDAPSPLRGFVGVAFRVSGKRSGFECIYLRPKNGRSDDQLQRNHSVQYISVPDFPWQRLRSESPGKYEPYVDLIPGQWTHVKIVVAGKTARLYVNRAEQPVLLVNDLKLLPSTGSIALWVGPGTIAHFANMMVGR